MNHDTAVTKAKEIAERVLAPAARQNDKDGRFSSDATAALGEAGLLGLMLPEEVEGAALGPRSFAAVVAALAEVDASAAMVYLMHICAAATMSASGPPGASGFSLSSVSRSVKSIGSSAMAAPPSAIAAPMARKPPLVTARKFITSSCCAARL